MKGVSIRIKAKPLLYLFRFLSDGLRGDGNGRQARAVNGCDKWQHGGRALSSLSAPSLSSFASAAMAQQTHMPLFWATCAGRATSNSASSKGRAWRSKRGGNTSTSASPISGQTQGGQKNTYHSMTATGDRQKNGRRRRQKQRGAGKTSKTARLLQNKYRGGISNWQRSCARALAEKEKEKLKRLA